MRCYLLIGTTAFLLTNVSAYPEAHAGNRLLGKVTQTYKRVMGATKGRIQKLDHKLQQRSDAYRTHREFSNYVRSMPADALAKIKNDFRRGTRPKAVSYALQHQAEKPATRSMLTWYKRYLTRKDRQLNREIDNLTTAVNLKKSGQYPVRINRYFPIGGSLREQLHWDKKLLNTRTKERQVLLQEMTRLKAALGE